MRRLIPLTLCATLAGTAAQAQSQLARGVMPDLRRAGVSEACIAQLTQHDFAGLKLIQDSRNHSSGRKLQLMKFEAEQACGDTRSFIFDAFN